MKQEKVQKKVGDFMGGKVLDLPEFRIYRQGLADGEKKGEKKLKKLEDENEKLRRENEELKKMINTN